MIPLPRPQRTQHRLASTAPRISAGIKLGLSLHFMIAEREERERERKTARDFLQGVGRDAASALAMMQANCFCTSWNLIRYNGCATTLSVCVLAGAEQLVGQLKEEKMLEIWGRRNSNNVMPVMWTVGEVGLEHVRHNVEAWYERLSSRPAHQQHVIFLFGTAPDERLAFEQNGA